MTTRQAKKRRRLIQLSRFTISKIEYAVRTLESNRNFKSHGFNHVKRVAIGAKWFAQNLGQSKHDQDIVYVAGLVHDLGRPKSEQVDHTQTSVDLASRLLKRFNLDPMDRKAVLRLVAMHRSGKADLNQQVVFLADKLWEQMGAYVVFRRAVFVTEVEDYQNWNWVKANIHQNQVRLQRFSPKTFSKRFRKLAKYQYQWPLRALQASLNQEPWICELIDYCGKKAQKKGWNLDRIIKSFKPNYKIGKAFQKEAILYITGKIRKTFQERIEP